MIWPSPAHEHGIMWEAHHNPKQHHQSNYGTDTVAVSPQSVWLYFSNTSKQAAKYEWKKPHLYPMSLAEVKHGFKLESSAHSVCRVQGGCLYNQTVFEVCFGASARLRMWLGNTAVLWVEAPEGHNSPTEQLIVAIICRGRCRLGAKQCYRAPVKGGRTPKVKVALSFDCKCVLFNDLIIHQVLLQHHVAQHRWWWTGNSDFPAVLCFNLVGNQLCLTDLILPDWVGTKHNSSCSLCILTCGIYHRIQTVTRPTVNRARDIRRSKWCFNAE